MVTNLAINDYYDDGQTRYWQNTIYQPLNIGVALPNDTHSTVDQFSTRVNSVENFYQPSSYSVTVSVGENVVLKSPYYSHLPTVEINGEPVKSISEERTSRSSTENYIF
jgi:hypothetical protein